MLVNCFISSSKNTEYSPCESVLKYENSSLMALRTNCQCVGVIFHARYLFKIRVSLGNNVRFWIRFWDNVWVMEVYGEGEAYALPSDFMLAF